MHLLRRLKIPFLSSKRSLESHIQESQQLESSICFFWLAECSDSDCCALSVYRFSIHLSMECNVVPYCFGVHVYNRKKTT